MLFHSTKCLPVSLLLTPHLKLTHRLPASLLVIAGGKKAMISSSSSSSSNGPDSYTTIRERVSFEREIKKSKFMAIAGPISDEQSAQSFLSEVFVPHFFLPFSSFSSATPFRVRDSRATHNCWAYKLGDLYRCNDDGEPSSTAGKPIYSAIVSSGIDRVMVVVIRYFGGIKLGTGGLVRAYGGVTTECLRSAPTCLVKSKVMNYVIGLLQLFFFIKKLIFYSCGEISQILIGLEVPFDLLGVIYHQVNPDSIINLF
ncbi:hypothetical protein HHK36_031951 [Tetracentron sinense]|uniref:Impact N-terminal domain-containing protein n=1 Tax=Tetracentron sinense TaxID=13715 RepID=A0A835D005_TETSI|nr:hypothetical protein HHK36_031951 [Tetracentron sinense]